MDNKNNELFNGIIDVPTTSTNNIEPNLEMGVYQNIQPQEDMEIIDVSMNNSEVETVNTTEEQSNTPEIIDFDLDVQPEEINEQGKVVNHQLLQNLNKDTNSLVNPNMIINPLGKSEESSVSSNIEEPKVDYDEGKVKKGYIFMAIIFLIILVFIIFLPQIMSFIGI